MQFGEEVPSPSKPTLDASLRFADLGTEDSEDLTAVPLAANGAQASMLSFCGVCVASFGGKSDSGCPCHVPPSADPSAAWLFLLAPGLAALVPLAPSPPLPAARILRQQTWGPQRHGLP